MPCFVNLCSFWGNQCRTLAARLDMLGMMTPVCGRACQEGLPPGICGAGSEVRDAAEPGVAACICTQYLKSTMASCPWQQAAWQLLLSPHSFFECNAIHPLGDIARGNCMLK